MIETIADLKSRIAALPDDMPVVLNPGLSGEDEPVEYALDDENEDGVTRFVIG